MFKKGKVFDPPQRLSQIFTNSIKLTSTEILVFRTEYRVSDVNRNK